MKIELEFYKSYLESTIDNKNIVQPAHLQCREKILHVVTYKWQYINILNSSGFFLSELEEIKSIIYIVWRPQTLGWDYSGTGNNCL